MFWPRAVDPHSFFCGSESGSTALFWNLVFSILLCWCCLCYWWCCYCWYCITAAAAVAVDDDAETAAAEAALQYLHCAGIRARDSASADKCSTTMSYTRPRLLFFKFYFYQWTTSAASCSVGVASNGAKLKICKVFIRKILRPIYSYCMYLRLYKQKYGECTASKTHGQFQWLIN